MMSRAEKLKSELEPKIESLQRAIISCERCPRLRAHCLKIAQEKRKQFANEIYWGLPVPSFGDPNAPLMIVGLAPAAHGGNRTGRMFTGDQSGLWLYRALHRAGFANQATSIDRNDGLRLVNAYITASAHCAPPDNKPTLEEIENCSGYLDAEIRLMPQVKVFLVLGQIGLKTLWRRIPTEWKPQLAIPKFSHGMQLELNNGKWIVASFHPSQQNTFTGRLTQPMFDSIFSQVKDRLKTNIF